jgi:zinc protease
VILKRICFFTAAAAIAAALGLPAWAANDGAGKVADFTLSNGLELVVIPDHRAPVITHMIWYKVGAADETPGKSGLAHFLEHLMFKGTAKHPAGQFSQVVARIGGQENAFTSNDYTAFFQRVPRQQLKTVMEFEADRMTGLQLTDNVVLPERDVILEEQNQRVRNNPHARLDEQVDAALFLNNPYGKPVIGWRHEREGLTRDDAIGF